MRIRAAVRGIARLRGVADGHRDKAAASVTDAPAVTRRTVGEIAARFAGNFD
jgi:hypothetical protein